MDEMVESYKCVFDAIEPVMGEFNDLKPHYELFRQKSLADLLKCRDFGTNIEEKLKFE